MKTFLSFLILLLAAALSFWFYSHKPQTKKVKPQRPVSLVKTVAVQASSEPVYFEAAGRVIPAQQVELQSEVEGRIIEQHPELVPGGIIEKDELVVQIDPLDYRLQVSEREAELATAQYEMKVEEGRQIIARQEWQLLEKELAGDQVSKHLALREPHLENVHARLAAAESRLVAARLSEKRTAIRAPFTGLVLEEAVEKGQFVGKQRPIATLVATDQFWVRVSVPLFLLPRLRFSGRPGEEGSSARIILEQGDGGVTSRNGALFKLQGDLDPKTRKARILVTVEDPFNLQEHGAGKEGGKMLLGSYVKVRIDAGVLDNVYVIPRAALREGARLWVIGGEGRLDIREVTVLWRRVDEVLVDAQLAPDERIIVSRLQSPIPGMEIRDQAGKTMGKE